MNLIKLNARYKDLHNGILRSRNHATTVKRRFQFSLKVWLPSLLNASLPYAFCSYADLIDVLFQFYGTEYVKLVDLKAFDADLSRYYFRLCTRLRLVPTRLGETSSFASNAEKRC